MSVSKTYRFAEFELDLDAHRLRLHGQSLRIERRPLDLLIMLVQRHGRLVPREEIVAALWPKNVIIDFDSGLNTLVRKIRSVLGDSPDEPRFVETVQGRGYRFIAAVTEPAAEAPQMPPPVAESPRNRTRLAGALLFGVLFVGSVAFWQMRSGGLEPTRIAILPFENLTGDERLGYLAAGIAEETNMSLARIDLPDLAVIGVVSGRALANSERPLNAVGKELGVDFIVTSSLRLEQSRIRLTSRLIRVADSEQIWSASFDRELTNLLGLQRELSIAVAEQIRQRLSPSVAAAIDRRQTQNPEAYELYLKGRYEWTQFKPDSIPKALAYYRQAVEKDPHYALAWAGIAHALITSTVTVSADRQSVIPASRDALERALKYGPDLAETQLALGSYYGFLEGDPARAEAAARRSIELDPNSAMCHMFLGMALSRQDKYVEARAMMRRARELDPLFPLMFANSSFVSLSANEPQEARELAMQAIAIDPEFWPGYLHLGAALYELGDYEGSIKAYMDAEKLSGNTSTSATAGRAWVLGRIGRHDEARDILEELLTRAAERSVPPIDIASMYAGLGEIDPAFEWLERGVAEQEISCIDLQRSRELGSLRSDLRFERLVDQCSNIQIPLD